MEDQLGPIAVPAEAPSDLVKIHTILSSLSTQPMPKNPQEQKLAPLFEQYPDMDYILSSIVLEKFCEATSFGALYGDTSEGVKSLETLRGIDFPPEGDLIANLLHLIARMSDGAFSVGVWDMASGSGASSGGNASFDTQRGMARAELDKRGWPEYDLAHYSQFSKPKG